MIAKFLEWLLGFFSKKPAKQEAIEKRIEDGEKKLKEIANEKNSDDDLVKYLND